jgi:hypothetical protein
MQPNSNQRPTHLITKSGAAVFYLESGYLAYGRGLAIGVFGILGDARIKCLSLSRIWEKVCQPGSTDALPGFFFGRLCGGSDPYRLFNELF